MTTSQSITAVKQLILPALLGLFITGSEPRGEGLCRFLPENDLYLEDQMSAANGIDRRAFDEIIDLAADHYRPIMAAHGASLVIQKFWEDPTVNAYARRLGNQWEVAMYGGLARRAEVTRDGFLLVVCHELGHHLGGFPFKGARWAANEGQSDYFATQACARHLWPKLRELDLVSSNASSAMIGEADLPDVVVRSCNQAFASSAGDQRAYCYRSALAGASLGRLFSALKDGTPVDFETPDETKVEATRDAHPNGQCRLDTYFQGALCRRGFDDHLIPGLNHPNGQQSVEAEIIAAQHSCTEEWADAFGYRPRCWYKGRASLLSIIARGFVERSGNGNGVMEPGEAFSLDAAIINHSDRAVDQARMDLSIDQPKMHLDRTSLDLGPLGPRASEDLAEQILIFVDDEVPCGTEAQLTMKARSDSDDSVYSMALPLVIGRPESGPVLRKDVRQSIPDHDPLGLVTVLEANLPRTNRGYRADSVYIDLTHADTRDLSITITAPNGRQKTLFEGAPGTVVRASFDLKDLGSGPGEWRLQVTDSKEFYTGKLQYWKLGFTGFSCEKS